MPRLHTFRRTISRRWILFGLATLALAACSNGGDVGTPDPTPTAPEPATRWNAVDSVVRAQIERDVVPNNLTLSVYDARDSLVFERSYGNFEATRRVAVASASKLVSAVMLLDVVSTGDLTLESTTGDVLGWTGAVGTITLRHLLSFTSGLPNENGCTFNPLITLASCVATIGSESLRAAPGTRFDYGSTHLHVAARMAEVATGQSWQALFRERLADPLGWSTPSRFFTFPNQGLGEINPLVAGGLRATAREYGRLLGLVYHRGQLGGVELATPALFDAQARAPYPGALIGNSPYGSTPAAFRYGFGVWLECGTPAAGCASVSSAGLFGFTPWIDRDAQYYATIAMERSDGGATVFSVLLQQALKPFIRDAIAAR